SARRALDCAIDIQRALQEHTAGHPEETLQVRIGLHTGEVVREGDDFFGKNVAMAARVAGAARGGEILVSSLVKELADTGDIGFGAAREAELKGFSGTRSLHEVIWAEQVAPGIRARSEPAPPTASADAAAAIRPEPAAPTADVKAGKDTAERLLLAARVAIVGRDVEL